MGAMIGIMGFISAAKVPGSVPALEGLVKTTTLDVMAPLVCSLRRSGDVAIRSTWRRTLRASEIRSVKHNSEQVGAPCFLCSCTPKGTVILCHLSSHSRHRLVGCSRKRCNTFYEYVTVFPV